MDANEFNELLTRLLSRALKEGVGQQKFDFVTMIGLLEIHKGGLVKMNSELAAQLAAQNRPRILTPGNG